MLTLVTHCHQVSFPGPAGGRRCQAKIFGLPRSFSTQIHSSTLNHDSSSIQSATHPVPRELPYVPWSPLVGHKGKRTWPSWPGKPGQGYSTWQLPSSHTVIAGTLGEESGGVPPGSNSDSTDAKCSFRSCPCLRSHSHALGTWCASIHHSAWAVMLAWLPVPPSALALCFILTTEISNCIFPVALVLSIPVSFLSL